MEKIAIKRLKYLSVALLLFYMFLLGGCFDVPKTYNPDEQRAVIEKEKYNTSVLNGIKSYKRYSTLLSEYANTIINNLTGDKEFCVEDVSSANVPVEIKNKLDSAFNKTPFLICVKFSVCKDKTVNFEIETKQIDSRAFIRHSLIFGNPAEQTGYEKKDTSLAPDCTYRIEFFHAGH